MHGAVAPALPVRCQRVVVSGIDVFELADRVGAVGVSSALSSATVWPTLAAAIASIETEGRVVRV